MDYRVVVTRDAEEDLERFIQYLSIEKKNMQAAENVLNDYDATIESLKYVAGSLKLCDNPKRNNGLQTGRASGTCRENCQNAGFR